ncbi:hypothetical protein H920_12763 [Fukomys damarensis]|uniref:Uncharacterized protein n=1 Tax=Fukomys damarensis TaxID=885580 RepID=A0A091D6G5_FUKDA|nr:hypothetical protein H920_12763 [Fukomys damarensis]
MRVRITGLSTTGRARHELTRVWEGSERSEKWQPEDPRGSRPRGFLLRPKYLQMVCECGGAEGRVKAGEGFNLNDGSHRLAA